MSKDPIDTIYTPWNDERMLKPLNAAHPLKKNTRANHSENHRPGDQKNEKKARKGIRREGQRKNTWEYQIRNA
jgi:hypothetical protein